MATSYFSTPQEQGTFPIGKNAESVVIEGHISVDLLESVQGAWAEGVTMSTVRSSDNTLQIRRPPSFVFDLHQRGLTTSKQVRVTGTRTISFGCGCHSGLTNHEKSGLPTIAAFQPPGDSNSPFTP